MTIKRPKSAPGTLVVLEHTSRILKGNPLGDPHVRKLAVWLPPGYDADPKARYPVLYDLVGFTGSGIAHTHWKPFGDNVIERAARSLARGENAQQVLEQLSHSLTNKFLHAPTHALNHANDDDREQLLNTLRRLYQLKQAE